MYSLHYNKVLIGTYMSHGYIKVKLITMIMVLFMNS